MKNTINPLLNKKTIALFWAVVGVVSLTAGYMHARKPVANLKIINATEVQARMAAGAHVVNVLSPKTYADAHIKGSMNIPLKQLKSRAGQFDKSQTLVVYCASSSCDASHKAAQVLWRAGFKNVFVYEGGMKDWRDKNLPVAGPCKMRYLQSSTDKAKISKTTKKKPVAYAKTKTEKRIRRGSAKTQPTVKTTKKGKAAKTKTKKIRTQKTKKVKTAKAGTKTKPSKKPKKQKATRKQKREKKETLRFSPIE